MNYHGINNAIPDQKINFEMKPNRKHKKQVLQTWGSSFASILSLVNGSTWLPCCAIMKTAKYWHRIQKNNKKGIPKHFGFMLRVFVMISRKGQKLVSSRNWDHDMEESDEDPATGLFIFQICFLPWKTFTHKEKCKIWQFEALSWKRQKPTLNSASLNKECTQALCGFWSLD